MRGYLRVIAGLLMFFVVLVEITRDDVDQILRSVQTACDLSTAQGNNDKISAETNASLALVSTQKDGIPQALLSDHFCVPWQVNTDEWWTHHPEWYNADNNDTHTCFTRRNDEEARRYMEIYENQWKNDCSKVYTKFIWCSGWGSDFINIVYPMMNAMDIKRPFAMQKFDRSGWHYAANKKDHGSNPACPKKDLTCYFLPTTNCKPNSTDVDENYPKITEKEKVLYDSVYNYITRPQQWLRKETYHFVKKLETEIVQPCAVVHVRRADIILHDDFSRKYFPVSAYVDMLPENRREHILLLTDDSNAIDEAHEFFPKISWHYINRTRFRGSEGGWENQTPSKDPKKEVITILGTFQLVQLCDTFVHGQSTFSDEIYRRMSSEKEVQRFVVTSGEVFSKNNANSEKLLKKHLSEARKTNGNKTEALVKSKHSERHG